MSTNEMRLRYERKIDEERKRSDRFLIVGVIAAFVAGFMFGIPVDIFM